MQSQTSDFVSDSQVQSWNLNWIINRDHRCVNLNPLQVPSYLESDQNVWFRKACFVPILVVWSSLCSKSIKDNAKASGNFPGRRTEVWVHPRKTEFRARTLLAECSPRPTNFFVDIWTNLVVQKFLFPHFFGRRRDLCHLSPDLLLFRPIWSSSQIIFEDTVINFQEFCPTRNKFLSMTFSSEYFVWVETYQDRVLL